MLLSDEEIADAVLEGIAPALDGFAARISDLEARLVAAESRVPAKGTDGIGLAGAMIDRDDNLVITLSNGETKNLGRVAGRDGVSIAPAAVDAMVAEKVAAAVKALPPPEPGKPADDAAILAALRADIAEATSEKAFERRVAAEVAKRLDLQALAAQAAALVPKPQDGQPGKNVDPVEVERMVAAEVERREAEIVTRVLAGIRQPEDGAPGKNVDMNEVRALVSAEVKAAVAALPPAEPGQDAKPEDIARAVDAAVQHRAAEIAQAAAALIPAPAPGKDADPAETAALVRIEVEKAVAAIPRPQDGKSVEPAEVEAMVKAAVERLPKPADGVGLAGALIDRSGELVVTLTNGTTKSLGPVVGRDADMAALKLQLDEAVAAIPRPRDGVDGLGFDDLTVEYDGERTVTWRFEKGERVKEFAMAMPVILDRGVYTAGKGYEPGDGVTWAGSYWIAQRATDAKPGDGEGWRLAVKKGRDGKEIVKLPPEPPKPVQI